MVKANSQRRSGTLSDRTGRFVLIAFVVAVAAFGGGARGDILSLAILRPLAVVVIAFALLHADQGALTSVKLPLLVVVGCVIANAAQLVPMPPSVWHMLPDRSPIAAIEKVLGDSELWRPLSLTPSATLNALFSLTVPTAAILLAAISRVNTGFAVRVWFWTAIASASLGAAQMVVGGSLYPYAVTSDGLPVGLFANSNHQALILAVAIALLPTLHRYDVFKPSLGFTAALLLLFIILLNGSRAGVALGIIAVALVIADLWVVLGSKANLRPGGQTPRRDRWHEALTVRRAALVVLPLLIVASALSASGAGVGLSALSQDLERTELRLAALPTVLDLVERHALLGAGGGAFPLVFQMIEPTELLGPNYLNHVHNDVLEPVIDYGLAGAAFVLLLTVAMTRMMIVIWRQEASVSLPRRLSLLAPFTFLAASSVIDYPLRVPLIQVIVLLWALGLCGLGGERTAGCSRRTTPKGL